ncbi:MAG: hypothetical protein ACO4AU_09775 [bacterium]|jgi:hypothetical protein
MTEPVQLQRGLYREFSDPPEAVWGGETPLLPQSRIGDPFQGGQDYHFEESSVMRGLLEWCTTVGFAKLERAVAEAQLLPGEERIVQVESRTYRLEASPCGTDQLHITVWKR